MQSDPDLKAEVSTTDETPAANASTGSLRQSLWKWILASLAIVLPGILVAMTHLPLQVRGASAIICGLAVLLCGSYLLGQALDLYTRRIEAKLGDEPGGDETLTAAQE